MSSIDRLVASTQLSPISVGIVDPGREAHYIPVLEFLESKDMLASVSTYTPCDLQVRPDIVLASDEWCPEYSLKLVQAKDQGIPTLHIADGVVKWGNVWSNPRSLSENSGMPLFQPILADRIACIGPLQARIFSSWGQAKKVALTGLPRLDNYSFPLSCSTKITAFEAFSCLQN